MSLIPSESLSFPDDFSRSISRARVLHEMERYTRRQEPTRRQQPKKQEIPVAARIPKAITKTPLLPKEQSPPPKPEPNGNGRKSEAPIASRELPQRRAIARTPMLGRSIGHAVPLKIHAQPPRVKAEAPVQSKPNPSEKVDVDLAKKPETPPAILSDKPTIEPLAMPAIPRRRRKRLARFLKIEIPALVVLAACATAGLTHQLVDPIAKMILNGVTIVAAFVVAITPIAIFAKSPTLPPLER